MIQWIDDIHNFWRFRSVQFGTLSTAFAAMLAAYGAAEAISPDLVRSIPHWFLTVCSLGSMISAGLGVFYRGVKQGNLPAK